MLHYLIKVTDNCLPSIIVLALLLFLASRLGRNSEGPFRRYGLSLGAAAALVYAVLKRNTGFAVREYYDLGVIVPSLVLSLCLLVAMKPLFAEGREKPVGLGGKALVTLLLASWVAYMLPNILLYPFEFAVGMESIFNTDFFFRVTGYVTGLLVMLLAGFALYKIAAALPRRVLLLLFAALLLVFFAKQGLEAVQILVGRHMIPRYSWLMGLVIFILTHENWFVFALMGFASLLAVILILRAQFEPIRGGNPALIRKQKAGHRSQRRYATCLLLCFILSSLTITVLREYANRGVEISPPLETFAEDGRILLPIETINDGKLHRFVYQSGGTGVRYIVIKKSETAYGVGLDACDICGPSGYYQRKDQVVCKLCDVVMNISTIGFPGGCNPVPLRFSVSQGKMVIRAADLDAEKQRFQ